MHAFSPNSTVTQGIAVRGPCHRRLRAINRVGITNIRDPWIVATRKLDHAFADHSCLVSQVLPICSLRTNDGVQESGPVALSSLSLFNTWGFPASYPRRILWINTTPPARTYPSIACGKGCSQRLSKECGFKVSVSDITT